MENFGFDKEVLREFEFLLSQGFRVSEANPTQVIYSSELYEIEVFYGPRSQEIDIGVRSVPPSKYGTASFSVLVAVFDRAAGGARPMAPIVRTREGVIDEVRKLASDFRKYVDINAFKTRGLQERIESVGLELANARYKSVSWSEMRGRFASMWEEGQYKALVNLFEPFRKSLSTDEVAKLDQAKTKSLTHEG